MDELHEKMTEELELLVSGDDWARMLAAASKFHDYSLNNILLILTQRPSASRVAGYNTWKKLNRQVTKGAKGIAILAPCIYTSKTDAAEDASVTTTQDAGGRRVLRGFRTTHVFDIADTKGEDVPDVVPTLLTADGPSDGWNVVAGLVEAEGYAVDRHECSPANGVTNFTQHTVSVRPGLAPAQALKTLLHELAHIKCEHGANGGVERHIAEVEAESIAYLTCSRLGIDSASYTFPYVAKWASGDLELVKRTADRVIKIAHEIVANIEAIDTVGATALLEAPEPPHGPTT